MIWSITVKEITLLKGKLIYVIRNALRFVADVDLNILPCSADFTRVDGPTTLEV